MELEYSEKKTASLVPPSQNQNTIKNETLTYETSNHTNTKVDI